jgi:ribosomal protein S18 acetylase RimI-like enzyme
MISDEQITIEAITPDDLPTFAMALDSGAPSPAMEAHVTELWSSGESRPAWSFVARSGDVVAARLLYWSLPSKPEDMFIGAFRVRKSPEAFAAGLALLAGSLDLMAPYGPRLVDARIQLAREADPDLKRRILLAAGFRMAQEKLHVVRPGNEPVAGPGWSLRYRTLAEVGNEAFVEAIERVTNGTLDRSDLMTIERLGTHAAARAYFDTLSDLHLDPEAWELAFDDAGELVGLVVPQLLEPGLGTVNYIGVIPSMRGRGLGVELIRRALSTISARYDVEKVIADTDLGNMPTREAVRKAGFSEDGVTEIYVRDMRTGG